MIEMFGIWFSKPIVDVVGYFMVSFLTLMVLVSVFLLYHYVPSIYRKYMDSIKKSFSGFYSGK